MRSRKSWKIIQRQDLARSNLVATSLIIRPGHVLKLERRLVLIELLLNELVSSVDGATGAIIVAADGEAVQWGASVGSERLRLRGAYVAFVMQTFRAAATRAGLGRLTHLVVEYNGATLIAQEIDDDCSVVLELKPKASVGRALYRMETAAARLRDKITV